MEGNFKVDVGKRAARELRKLPAERRTEILNDLEILEENRFFAPGKKIRKLEGHWRKKVYRIRVGDYRAIYYVEGQQVNVVAVIHRKDLKKELSKLNL